MFTDKKYIKELLSLMIHKNAYNAAYSTLFLQTVFIRKSSEDALTGDINKQIFSKEVGDFLVEIGCFEQKVLAIVDYTIKDSSLSDTDKERVDNVISLV